MKRALFLPALFFSLLAPAQVVTFPKTLPQNAFSIGSGALYNSDVFAFDAQGMSFYIHAGYGLQYPLDVNISYGRYLNGESRNYFGVDMQYLFYETRKSYFSVITGLHRREEFGFDLAGVFTYAVRYWLNLSAGLDIDLDFATDVNPRFRLPLNIGVTLGEPAYLYFEYNLPVSERAWSITALGVNFIIR